MKIKRVGFSSFIFNFDTMSIVTDPLLSASYGDKIGTQEADIVLITQEDFMGELGAEAVAKEAKIKPKSAEEVMTLANPGDFEVGGVIIRRNLKSNFYVMDHKEIRVVYVGAHSDSISDKDTDNLGDVDILVMPVGNGKGMIQYDKFQKLISNIDPTVLVLSQYMVPNLETDEDLKSSEDFIKHFGYTHVKNEKTFNFTSGKEQENKMLEVVILE